MSEVKGELWPLDRFGRAQNAADKTRLTPLVRRVSRAIAEAYRARLGPSLHSVYLLGPSARGRSGAIEALGLLRMTADEHGSAAWLEETSGAIRARWPAAGRPELTLAAWRDVFPEDDIFSLLRFRLGVNSLCLAGRDVGRLVRPQRLSVAASNAWIVGARERVAAAAGRIELAAREDDVRRESRSLGRDLLATAFALVMAHEGVYTEDPDLQRDFVALNFPEREADADLAFKLAQTPSEIASEVMTLLEGFGRWLVVACDAWLDKNNPHRLATLPA